MPGCGLRGLIGKRCKSAAAACLVLCGSGLSQSTVHKLRTPPMIPPAATIAVEPLGFRAPSRWYLTARVPSASLDFIDDTHLLFTFHQSALMRREEKQPDEDEDQMITALVLELPSGRVTEQATWRLHDKGRYLWSLGQGRFLERERNTLYLVDRSLERRALYFDAPGAVVAVELSTDGSKLIVEFEEPLPVSAASPEQPTLGDSPRRRTHQVQLLVIDTKTAKVEHKATVAHAVALPLVEGGYLEVKQQKAKQWDVLLQPFGGESAKVAEVTSTCRPLLDPISPQVFMAQLCLPYTGDRLVQAWALDGKKLWEQQWESRYVWANYAYAENGSRFAYESIELDHSIAALDPVEETSITGQPVGVFDVADGALQLVSSAQPILSAGQNYALSSDGERFAVLRAGAIEVYKLPPAPVR